MRIFIAKNLLSRTHNQLIIASLLLCFAGHSHVVSAQITHTNKIESAQTVSPDELPSMEELIDLVGPIALFPDDLLALTLEAASYPIEIVSANRMKKNPKKRQKINPDWDDSVVALLNYPEILDMLDRDIEWTQKLGKAKTTLPVLVMQAIEQFRTEARQTGNLKSDSYQVVSVNEDRIIIRHKNKDRIYVPYYDPQKVRVRQNRTVYHYYPNAYPIYYYPYQSSFYFDEPFYGIDSVFGLSWNRYQFNRYSHAHFLHPFYGTTYHPRHFRRSRPFNSLARREENRDFNRPNRNKRISPSIYEDRGMVSGPQDLRRNRKPLNRDQNVDLESSHIKNSNTSFRVLERHRPQRQATTRAKSFSKLGNQEIMRYPAQTKIKNSAQPQSRYDRR